jgi:S1-C subfamily serine protease
VLIATSVGADPSATVRVIPSDVQGAWGLGDTIPGLGRIDHVGPKTITFVDAAGRRARLDLLDPAAVDPGAGAATPGAGSAAAIASADPFAGRIRKLDDHTYEVDRALVRELVSGAAKPGAVRIVPVLDHGQVDGVRFGGVKPDSLPAAIGLHSGDVLATIDGAPIRNAQQLLDLYASLDQKSAVQLGGSRAGAPLAIELRLR